MLATVWQFSPLAHDIPQGHTINRGDLDVVGISFSEGLAPISAQDFSQIVGRTASVSLLRGTLLSKSDLSCARRSGPRKGSCGGRHKGWPTSRLEVWLSGTKST